MLQEDKQFGKASAIRQQAEKIVAQNFLELPESRDSFSTDAAKDILHEFRVHQIELEMQNDELRRTQEELEASRARYFDLYDLAPVGYVAINEFGLILEANLTAACMLELEKADMLKNPLSHFVLPEYQDVYYFWRKALYETGATQSCEVRMKRKTGELCWARMIATSTCDPGGGESVFRVALSDITDLKKAEADAANAQSQLRQSQKMEAVGQFAGGVAHDFNNMLAVIKFAIVSLDSETKGNSSATESLEMINEAVDRARDITMKLLTFCRKDKIDVHGVHARKITDSLKGMLGFTLPKNVELEIAAAGEDCVLFCDQNQILQALVNVCNNAVDSMPDGGKLTIKSGEFSASEGICSICGERIGGRYCVIEIEDTGHGMTKGTIEKITEPFFTTKEIGKGTGLGLSVTLGIVRSHNGHLHISSKPGKGTCVKIYIPMAEKIAAAIRPDDKKRVLNGAETILVVDDEEMMLSMVKKMLGGHGYKTLLASNGETALRLYREHADEISVVIMDLMMPGMDGAEVNRRLKEINPDVKTVFMSGYCESGLIEKLLKDKHNRFAQKPCAPSDLCGYIRGLIDE